MSDELLLIEREFVANGYSLDLVRRAINMYFKFFTSHEVSGMRMFIIGYIIRDKEA